MKKMQEKKNDSHQSITRHPNFWVFVVVGFMLLSIATAGPLVFKAYADMSSARDSIVQVKNAIMAQAIIDNDYDTWNSMVTDPRIKSEVNKSNFSQFTEAYKLLQEGRLEEADAYKRALGIKIAKENSAVKSSAIATALEDRDYKSWVKAVDPKTASKVPGDKFDDYVKSAALIEAGFISKSAKVKQITGLKKAYEYISSSHE